MRRTLQSGETSSDPAPLSSIRLRECKTRRSVTDAVLVRQEAYLSSRRVRAPERKGARRDGGRGLPHPDVHNDVKRMPDCCIVRHCLSLDPRRLSHTPARFARINLRCVLTRFCYRRASRLMMEGTLATHDTPRGDCPLNHRRKIRFRPRSAELPI